MKYKVMTNSGRAMPVIENVRTIKHVDGYFYFLDAREVILKVVHDSIVQYIDLVEEEAN